MYKMPYLIQHLVNIVVTVVNIVFTVVNIVVNVVDIAVTAVNIVVTAVDAVITIIVVVAVGSSHGILVIDISTCGEDAPHHVRYSSRDVQTESSSHSSWTQGHQRKADSYSGPKARRLHGKQ